MSALRRLAPLLTFSACLGSAQPRIFYSDIDSGPNSGGEDDAGAYVTIYGKGFGTNPGRITVGGGHARSVRVWADTRISFQLGEAATTGNIVVHSAGASSNGIPFTVRKGTIYFVAKNGNDTNDGSGSAPWATLQRARDAMAPGDITYVRNGVTAATNDDWSSCLLLGGQSGSSGNPIAMIAYPGETATIGSVTPTARGGCDFGIRTKGQGEHYWVFAGFNIRGGGEALSISGVRDWRIVANDVTCPNGDGPSSCFGTGDTSYLKAYGNNIHDTGHSRSSALYHGVYLGTGTNHVDFGWNTIANVRGCRGLHVYSSGGADLYDLQIHDNVIHDTQCDGIIVSTVDPSKPGGVNIYNNVVYNAGRGPSTPEKSGAFYCINVQGWTNRGTAGSGAVEVFGNTLYNCGSWTGEGYLGANGAITINGPNPEKRLRLRNNIIYQTAASPYLLIEDGRGRACAADNDCPRVFGSNNLFWGNGRAPQNPNLANSLNSNPLFVSPQAYDFRLQPGSPARGTGVPLPAVLDIDGYARGSAPDLGAYQATGVAIGSIRCNPAAAVTPFAGTCTIIFPLPVPAAGLSVSIRADGPAVTTPLSLEVRAGETRVSFPITTGVVPSRMQVNVAATVGSSLVSSVLWLLPPGDTTPAIGSVVNGASFQEDGLSPGGIITVFGVNLSGAQVLLDRAPIPVLYVSPHQISAVTPYSLSTGSFARLEVQSKGSISNASTLAVRRTTPAIFSLNYSGEGQALAYGADGLLNRDTQPAAKQSIIHFYSCGLGELDPAAVGGEPAPGQPLKPVSPVAVEIGGVTSPLVAAFTVPGLAPGVFQVSVRIPALAPSGPAVPLVLRTPDGSSQPGITIAVQ